APGAHVYRLVREGRGIGGLYRMWRTCRLQSCFGAVVGIIRPPYPMTASLSRHSSSAILLTSLRLSPAFWSALADSVPGARASLRGRPWPPHDGFRRVLGDSHFSLQHRPGLTELATTMDCVELFHATSHGDGTRGFIVAVPSSQPGDDPACRREAREQMRVALALCVAFETWAEGGEGFDFRSAEHGGC